MEGKITSEKFILDSTDHRVLGFYHKPANFQAKNCSGPLSHDHLVSSESQGHSQLVLEGTLGIIQFWHLILQLGKPRVK